MDRIRDDLLVFVIGGFLYNCIEVIYRGYSHGTMTLAGGLSFLIMYRLFRAHRDWPIWKKGVFGGVIITVIEFAFGCILNIGLGLAVWDYSDLPMNLWGQISLPSFVIWTLAGTVTALMTRPVRILLRSQPF